MTAAAARRSQAKRLFDAFGGVPKLFHALRAIGKERDLSTIYRWDLPKATGGTGGVVPTSALRDVAEAARIEGIFLPSEVFDPRALT